LGSFWSGRVDPGAKGVRRINFSERALEIEGALHGASVINIIRALLAEFRLSRWPAAMVSSNCSGSPPMQVTSRCPREAELERRQGRAWQYQQTRRSLSAQLVDDRGACRHPVRQNPRHQASPLARGVVGATADKGGGHCACEQDRENGLGVDGQR
jgi:hypothetical protein